MNLIINAFIPLFSSHIDIHRIVHINIHSIKNVLNLGLIDF
jgi:hypothetical protein